MLLNEIDSFAAEWLENLIAAGLIPPATVDTRSIADLSGSDCHETTHFFAGIGGWPLALRLAGWPDDLPVWTGSCPCQPFSSAGKRKGTADARHLWPEMFRLVGECRPAIVFGEQVASKDGLRWLDGVFADLEGAGYACGAADLCAASVNLPHVRQRLFWCAHTYGNNDFGKAASWESLVNKAGGQLCKNKQEREKWFSQLVSVGITEGPFAYAEARSMVHGIPNILGKIRGFGNAIVPQVAAVFVREVMEMLGIKQERGQDHANDNDCGVGGHPRAARRVGGVRRGEGRAG